MKTTLVLPGFLLALVQCHVSVLENAGLHHFEKKPVHFGVKAVNEAEPVPGNKKDCKPTDACLANGGYCIQSKNAEDCNGFFFPKECKSSLCSCCVEDRCDSNPCGPNSYCKSTPGSYECVCNAGFQKVDGTCVDLNECESNPCGPNSQCRNTNGSYECDCNAGYNKVNGACVDINECLSDVCFPDANCTNTPGSYQCECVPGFTFGQGVCEDINECDLGSYTCLSNEVCTNTRGSYTCQQPCSGGATYLPVNRRCAKFISRTTTFTVAEAWTFCAEISMYICAIDSPEEIIAYGTAFLQNVNGGDKSRKPRGLALTRALDWRE
ncbi:adhesion G protein-coupled receptor E2-like [Macrobrachium rosenbergii]|uniref:adhesion G protein-coupled receptor E2-like n=1 Tax=Macrobrachium rosenbergii TaxID=79674 RepID=UPI0034D54FE5